MKFIIVGAGDVGTSLAVNLASHQHYVTLIERDPEKITKEISSLNVQVFIGNGASPDLLVKAGIEFADYLIAVTNADETNIATCFISRLINPAPKRIARIRDLELLSGRIPQELIREYFDLIIDPEQAAAEYTMQLLKNPGAREIIEFEGGKLCIIALTVSPQAHLLERRLNQFKEYQQELPLLIVAIMRGSRLIVPKGEDKIRAGDVIYAVTVPDRKKLLFALAGKELHEGKSVMLWGSTTMARSLVGALEAKDTAVKMIVEDPETAGQLADQFKSSLILSGQGTDQNLLLEEHVADVDAFIAVTPDDENNVLAALLAKKLGAKTTIALVNKASYLPLISAIGVDVVISSRLAAASAIYRHIHSHAIVYESALQDQGGGFIELDVTRETALRGAPIKDLKLPHGIIVSAIFRQGQVIIPTGDDLIQEDDRIIIFVVKSAFRKLEKILNLKLEMFN